MPINAAVHRNLAVAIVEKDYYVTVVLRLLSRAGIAFPAKSSVTGMHPKHAAGLNFPLCLQCIRYTVPKCMLFDACTQDDTLMINNINSDSRDNLKEHTLLPLSSGRHFPAYICSDNPCGYFAIRTNVWSRRFRSHGKSDGKPILPDFGCVDSASNYGVACHSGFRTVSSRMSVYYQQHCRRALPPAPPSKGRCCAPCTLKHLATPRQARYVDLQAVMSAVCLLCLQFIQHRSIL